MKKTFLLLLTILAGIVFPGLPKLNASTSLKAGKIIKAIRIAASEVQECEPDSLLLPEIVVHRKGNYEIRTVVIDPGHGGHDPGCSGANSKEKHNCLAIGKYFAEALKLNYPSLNVIMTRSTDVFIPLDERASIATRNHADLFISIHCNFVPKAGQIHGTETYVLGLHATPENLEVAKRENASILYEENYQQTYGYDPNSTEAHIMFSMFQNAHLEHSILFAQKVQQNAASEAGRRDRGVKQAGFLVLRHATMPSVLVETGYLSNRNEEDYIRSRKGQKAMANALLLAFNDFKAETEGSERLYAVKKLDLDSDAVQDVEFVTAEISAAKTEEGKVIPVKQETASVQAPPEKRTNTAPVKVEPPKKNSLPSGEKSDLPAVTAPAKTETTPVNAKISASIPVVTTPAEAAPAASQSTDIQYRVQLAASPSMLDVAGGKWTKIDYLIEVVEEDRLFKYQVRNFATLSEANQARQKLRALGFADAFVVVYQNGRRIK